ncbi:HIT family protein [Gemmatimonadota bacterium]
MDDQCPFCEISPDQIVLSSSDHLAIRDSFPVSNGHMLVIPKRHVSSVTQLVDAEASAFFELMYKALEYVCDELKCDGVNIGINEGRAAGQTIMHLHMHIIPRYQGDVPDPRGGIRWIFPSKAQYWE